MTYPTSRTRTSAMPATEWLGWRLSAAIRVRAVYLLNLVRNRLLRTIHRAPSQAVQIVGPTRTREWPHQTMYEDLCNET